jgi:hypothetical protein
VFGGQRLSRMPRIILSMQIRPSCYPSWSALRILNHGLKCHKDTYDSKRLSQSVLSKYI